MSKDYSQIFPNLVYTNVAWTPEDLDLKLLDDLERSSTSYIR